MKNLLITFFALLLSIGLLSQSIGINKTGDPPLPGSILDIHSDSSGVLFPRTDTMSILLPSNSMVIFDTLNNAFYFYKENCWVRLYDSDVFQYFYADRDGDGFGDPWSSIFSPEPPPGYVIMGGDCDDLDWAINPAAFEICDDLDNNCDGNIDDIPCVNNGGVDCVSSTYMGSICGDQGVGFLFEAGCGEGWFTFELKECNVNTVNLVLSIVLDVPPNMDYDLTLYDSDCSTQLASSAAGGDTDETIDLIFTDNPVVDDTRSFYVHVVQFSGTECNDWLLNISGN